MYTDVGLFTPEWSTPGLQHTCSYSAGDATFSCGLKRNASRKCGLLFEKFAHLELTSLIFRVMVHTIALAQTLREEKLLIQSIFMLNAYAITL